MEPSYKIFWTYKARENGKGHDLDIEIHKFMKFLEDFGFGNFEIGGERFYVRLENKVLKCIQQYQINSFAKEYIRNLPIDLEHNCTRENLMELFHRKLYSLVHREQLYTLKMITPTIKRDTKTNSYKYFKNCFVEISSGAIKCFEYSELDAVIWDYQIINRNFQPLEWQVFITGNVFYQFLLNCMGQNTMRLNSLISILGYLMHTYKNPTTTKLVVMCDEKVSDEPNGGSGKSLTIMAVSQFVKTAFEDGKTFNPGGSFAFQQLEHDTKLVFIDDVLKHFNMEPLFSPITGGVVVERKYKNKVFVPSEDSPKFVVTTNYMIQGRGLSFERRKIELEFSDHYNKINTPENEFRQRFFDDWKEEEWLKFDNLMLYFIQCFINWGLVESPNINIAKRKLIQETKPEFVEFAELIPRDKELLKSSIFNDFTDKYPDFQDLKQRTFTKWLQIYAELTEDIHEMKDGHSDKVRHFKFVSKPKPVG
jgi:hypothetical protein